MKQRIITGVIAAALFIPIVIYGGVPFTVLVYALASIGLYELIRMKQAYAYFGTNSFSCSIIVDYFNSE